MLTLLGYIITATVLLLILIWLAPGLAGLLRR